MPLPLIWIGAGLAGAAIVNKNAPSVQRHRADVAVYPGESRKRVKPVPGALVCCGIMGVFEHSGIWLDEHIVELKGNGLIRAISPQRFLLNRSGQKIFIACDKEGVPLVETGTAERAASKIFSYAKYNVISQNCHQFCAKQVAKKHLPITSFLDLNRFLATHFNTSIYWYLAEI